ncbi:phenoloxidase-activating factor 2-like [Ischnura elegans]|uniref:phenoloxidase-activating factor 2-like n=1 Tax=Ischnura elegans TaxID=197161 RepID=UPI001ED86FF9|nr:phenoloxidase-activating factor 2-like [Ischnura elegans]
MANKVEKLTIIWLILALSSCVQTQAPQGDDLDALIDYVFTTPKPTDNQATATDGSCECVPYYLCQNNSIVIDGNGILDIRIKDEKCSNYLDVCCEAPLDEKIVPPSVTVQTGCGHRNPDGVGFRITGATDGEAQFAEFPWMTAVLRKERAPPIRGRNPQILNVFQCGGALIHPSVVLTAAHCVAGRRPGTLKVRAGEWDTQTKNELFGHEDRDVADIVIHEQYYAGALYNDVALLFLSQRIEPAENIGYACLPSQNEIPSGGTRCFASGWGKDVFGKEGRYQVILKKIDLPMVDRPQCVNSLRRTRLGPRFKLHSSFVCAGGEPGKDTCKGDGGSPLVCPIPGHPDRYMQTGIVAWGIGCGESGTPGVYANVARFRNWIDEQLVYNNLDTSYYRYQG